jgi:hypothetical protein
LREWCLPFSSLVIAKASGQIAPRISGVLADLSSRAAKPVDVGWERLGKGAQFTVSEKNWAPCPLKIKTWNSQLDSTPFAAYMATWSLFVLCLPGAILAMNGRFGMASLVVNKRLREPGISVALAVFVAP